MDEGWPICPWKPVCDEGCTVWAGNPVGEDPDGGKISAKISVSPKPKLSTASVFGEVCWRGSEWFELGWKEDMEATFCCWAGKLSAEEIALKGPSPKGSSNGCIKWTYFDDINYNPFTIKIRVRECALK